MKYILILISITVFVSCKNEKYLQQVNSKVESRNIVKRKDRSHKIDYDSITVTPLPLGNSFITFNFPTLVPTIDENDDNIINETTTKIDSIIKTVNHFAEIKSEIKFNSDIEINGTQYLLRAFPDRNSKIFENIYQLPNKYGFNIYIERVSNIYNKKNNTTILYSLAIYKGDVISNRYCIGYDYYGDLVESYKVWKIDKNFLLNTRIITNVAGNNETYISELDKFTITKTGDLVKYFDTESNIIKNSKETGKIENHLKEGIWFEINNFNGYINKPSYLEAQYKKGLPFGNWKYFNLVVDTKKGSILLMTEEYDKNGKLLKRNILKKQ